MPESDSPRPPNAWLRSVGYATAAPDASEALRGILREVVAACHAGAGAVIDGQEVSCREVQGCTGSDIDVVLGQDAVAQVLKRQEPWDEEEIRIPEPIAAADGFTLQSLAIYPLLVRGMPSGFLLLLYPGEKNPSVVDRENARGLAGLIALVLENDRLFEEARQATQARDRFLVALNHEIRTPASALTLTADLLRAGAYGPLPERLDRALRETEDLVQQMINVLRRVVDLGEVENQAVPSRGNILQPRETVTELLRRIEPAAKRKNLTLTLYVPRSLPPLQTDLGRFSRVLLYLLSNAIKYTSQGGIEVRVERRMRKVPPTRQEPFLVIQIKDTGRGIPPEELARIFEPFAQVEEGARTDSRTRGIGLGLPLARQLARSLGGDITLESKLGRGTVASVFVPYTQHV